MQFGILWGAQIASHTVGRLGGLAMTWIEFALPLALGLLLIASVGLMLYAWHKKKASGITSGEHQLSQSASDEIYYLAHHDALTGLLNRYAFKSTLDQLLKISDRTKVKTAVIFIDMDRFKTINDTLGHHVGDSLLSELANRLKLCVRASDLVGRLGGDEFIVAFSSIEQEIDVAHMAEKILNALSLPYQLGNNEIRITPSMGISVFPDDAHESEALMKYADTAMYHAKECGRNNYKFFTKEMNDAAMRRMTIEKDIHVALRRGEFILHYQPQINAMSGKVVGVEALIRWQHPTDGLIYPDSFISVAEETGLVTSIGEWVLRAACMQLKQWHTDIATKIQISVNLSAIEFNHPSLPACVKSALTDSGVDAGYLRLEITETAMMKDHESAIEMLNVLRSIGVTIEIDDFGTGYSSFGHLIRYPIDKLKIDSSFVRDIETDPKGATVCAAIISLAHNVGLSVIAEGVETEQQYKYLKRLGCDEMQGYHFCKAVPAEEISQFIEKMNAQSAVKEKHVEIVEVLIVDDDEFMCNALQKIMESMGLPATAMLEPMAALELLRKNPERFGLILLDMLMPKMSGVELFQAVRQINQDVPCVAVSAYKADYIRLALQPYENELNLKPGYNFFIIEKPFSASELVDLLQRILA